MALSPEDDARRDELVSQGETGATNSELHDLNASNNISRSDNELLYTTATRSDGGPQARAELRRRGYDI